MAYAKIVTGQYVTLNQQPASLSDRVLARLIDYVVLVAYIVALISLFSYIPALEDIPLVVLGLILPIPLYHLLMELFNHGQSVGKMAMGIKVVNVDGTSPGLSAFLLRSILAIVDITFMGIGLVSIVLTSKSQRLGDLAAGTMVVKSRMPYVPLPDYGFVMNGYVPSFPEAADLSMRQVEVISRVLYYKKPDRPKMINLMVKKIQQTMGIMPQATTEEEFLYTLLNDFSFYCSTIEA